MGAGTRVKIKATCGNCGREFVPELLEQSGGHCPWCGHAFSRDYTALAVKALERAQAAGTGLEDALDDIAEMDLDLQLDDEAILEPLREALRSLRARRSGV